MKRTFLLLILFFSAFMVSAQKDYFLKEGPLKFTIPGDKWMPINPTRTQYSTIWHYKRLHTKDSLGRKVFPEIVIIIETIPWSTELSAYSLKKQSAYKDLKNFKGEKVFTSSDGMLRLHYAMGQKSSYIDGNGISHTFYFIHAIKDNKGIQVIIDTPTSMFYTLEEEFTDVIRSLD